jgi:glycosyltransferase involved in cell wall biosynthesis
MNPLVSVIVPTYNCAAFLADTLDSVLGQDYAPLEVIVVDDGSTDGTRDVLARYAGRIRIFEQSNSGPAAARNLAVSKSKGVYLAFLDGDDLWLPGKLSYQMAYFASHPDVHVVYGEWLVWRPDEHGRYAPIVMPPPDRHIEVDDENSGWAYTKLITGECILHIIATVIHRSVFDRVGGFDESLRTGSDYDFWVRISRYYRVTKLRQVVAVYRHHASSVTYTLRTENNGYRLIRRAIELYGIRDGAGNEADARAVQKTLADLALTHGYRHLWGGNPSVSLSWLWRGLRHYPWRLKSYGHFILAAAKCCILPLSRRRRAP